MPTAALMDELVAVSRDASLREVFADADATELRAEIEAQRAISAWLARIGYPRQRVPAGPGKPQPALGRGDRPAGQR